MITVLESQLKKIDRLYSDTLAGEICKLIEEFQQKDLNNSENIILLKKLIKNKVHEGGRDRIRLLEQFSDGLTYFNVQFDSKKV